MKSKYQKELAQQPPQYYNTNLRKFTRALRPDEVTLRKQKLVGYTPAAGIVKQGKWGKQLATMSADTKDVKQGVGSLSEKADTIGADVVEMKESLKILKNNMTKEIQTKKMRSHFLRNYFWTRELGSGLWWNSF